MACLRRSRGPKALKKKVATTRGGDQAVDGWQVNIIGGSQGHEADLEHVREAVFVVSEMVRSNIADVIAATAARISKTNEG